MTWEAPSCSSHLGDESETELPLRVDFFFFLKQTKLTSKILLGTCITMEGTLWNRLQSLSCLIFVNLGVPRR